MSVPIPSLTKAVNELAAKAPALGVALEKPQLARLTLFLTRLLEYNCHTNLVSRSDPEAVVSEHILDSLSLVPVARELSLRQSAGRRPALADVGSGAGFPGLILGVVWEELDVLLIESVAKKARFLCEVVEALGICGRVKVENTRAEALARRPSLRSTFTFATARAVGSLDVVAELCLPFLARGGFLIAQKSQRQLPEELARAEKVLPILGGGPARVVVPNVEALGRSVALVVIEKTAETPERFPRPAAAIKRGPPHHP